VQTKAQKSGQKREHKESQLTGTEAAGSSNLNCNNELLEAKGKQDES
jgi:hypothetical protein